MRVPDQVRQNKASILWPDLKTGHREWSRLCLYLAIIILSAAPGPLSANPEFKQNIVTGLVKNKTRPDLQYTYYEMQLNRWNSACLLESRKPGSKRLQNADLDQAGEKPAQNNHQQVLLSCELKPGPLHLTMGHRYLPGFRSNFLSDQALLQGFADQPIARSTGSLFLMSSIPNPIDLQLGSFALNKHSGAGLAANWQNRFQLFYHPRSQVGALSIQSPGVFGKPVSRSIHQKTPGNDGLQDPDQTENRGISYYLDLLKSKTTYYGYGRLNQGQVLDQSFWLWEAERDPREDRYEIEHPPEQQSESGQKDLPPEEGIRTGRSGAIAGQACFQGWLCSHLAGHDRGLQGFRYSSLDLLPALAGETHRLIFGMRYTEQRWYDPSSRRPEQQETNQAKPSPEFSQHDSARQQVHPDHKLQANQIAWLGYQYFLEQQLRFQVGAGRGRKGPWIGQLKFLYLLGGWQSSLALAMFSAGDRPAGIFLWTSQDRKRRTGIRFFDNHDAALLMQIRSSILYFYLEISATEHKVQSYSQLQFKLSY